MCPVDGLGFHRRIPPRIEQVHVLRRREIQPVSARLEADQEQRRSIGRLEPVHAGLTVTRASIEVLVRHFERIETRPQQRQEARELREHQHLVALSRDLLQRRHHRIEFGRRQRRLGGINQRRMTRGLTQPQQRLENVHA